uniref:2-oxoacid oxidoreductase (ferredoxin) n=1 Tax=Fervidicoccus fontis TaxID=683846 RepID=A0A7J3ZKB0_9CREN
MSFKIRTIRDIPREELIAGGHNLCAGCTAGTIVRHLLKVAGRNTIVVTATGCVEVSTTPYPYTSWHVPWIHVAFENAAAVAAGIESGIKALARKGLVDSKERINVIALAGDGGTFDIGFQALSGMLERGHRVLYVVYDNEAYMNTGIQRSSATPPGAWTTTTPVGSRLRGEHRPKKSLIDIAIAHRIPYAASANPAYPVDMARKFEKGLSVEGPALVHVLMPCTTGWKFEPRYGIRIARLAVETGMWINWEYENGALRVTVKVPRRKPVEAYLRMQGRFSHLTKEEIEEIQRMVDLEVERVNKLVGETAIGPVVRDY